MDDIRKVLAGDRETIRVLATRWVSATKRRLFDVRLKNGQYELRAQPFFQNAAICFDTHDVAFMQLQLMCGLFLWEGYPFLDTPQSFFSEIFDRDLDETEIARLDTVRRNCFPDLIQICFLFHSIDFELFVRAIKHKFEQCR